ncbi:MAG: PD40 domain-containing protein [Planctomycetes bacterium]|nr:PD40 domain-containing protein [Planctomycetota bacterium]
MQNLLKNLVVIASLLAMGGLGTWIALRPQLPRGAGFTDGDQLLAATRTRDELRLARWDAPEPLSGPAEFAGAHDPALDPASGRLFFARGEAGSEELWQATPAADGWIARPLTELNSPRRELSPCFHDGWLFFASDRAGGQGGLDLWRAPLAGDRFLAPENLGAPINSASDERDPALRSTASAAAGAAAGAASGTPVELWFASNREVNGSGDFDLLFAKSDGVRFAAPAWADALLTPYDERAPAFSPDGRQLFFASDRPGGAGGADLWRSLRDGSGFLAPVTLGPLNGPGDELGPTLADDGFTLLYSANRVAGEAPLLLRTRTRELFPVPAPRFTLTDFTLLLLLALVALLAWLARRWEALDVIWKCMVVSLLLHLLFLWWTRRIDVEANTPSLRGPGQTFEIRVLGDLLATVARLEDRAQGDSIAAESTLPSVSALTRESVTPELAEAAPSESLTPLERTAAAPAAAAPSAASRDLAPSETAARAPSRDPVALATESYERRSGRAATPALSESEAGAAQPIAAGSAPFTPATASATEPRALDAAPLASATPAARAASTVAAAPAAAPRARNPVTRERGEREGGESASVATALPTDRAEVGGRAATTAAAPALQPARLRAASDGDARDGDAGGSATGAVTTAPPLRGTALLAANDAAESADAVAPRAEAPLAGGNAGATPTDSGSVPRSDGGALSPATRPLPAVALAPPNDSHAADEGRGNGERGAAPQLALAPREPAPSSDGGTAALPAVAPPAIGAAARAALLATDLAPSEPGPAGAPPLVATARGSEARELHAPARAADRAEPSAERDRGPSARPPAIAMAAPTDAAERGAAVDVATGAAAAAPPLAPRLAPQLAPALGSGRLANGTGAAAPQRASVLTNGAPPDLAPALAAAPLPLPAPAAERAPDRDAAPAGPATPRLYERRAGAAKAVALREGGGSEATERAVLAGLRYLAKVQHPKGWYGSANDVDLSSKYRDFRIGKSGLALLAFLGAGHTHRSGSEFSPNVERLLAWLQSRQDPASGHFGASEGYSHGIATYALAECFAMTQDEALVPALERALDHLLAMQQHGTRDPRKEGGWTYYYPEGPGFDAYPRASISAWQVMALESAKVGGFEVPAESLAAARDYFVGSFDPSFDGFRYTHNPSWLNNGYGTLPASTPASMFALVLLGERDHASVAAAERYVLDRKPEGYRWRGQDPFVRRGTANIYFWYYSTLALFCRGGPAWREWNDALQKTLLPTQQRDGSWEAIDLYARDYAGDDEQDRAYSTAMCVLMLEVYYRYFTPLLGAVGE